MTTGVFSILWCNGDDCEDEIRLSGLGQMRTLKEIAENKGWLIYFSSHFCPAHRGKVERFLKEGVQSE